MKVPIRVVASPELCVTGDAPVYMVVTGKNWANYYPSQPPSADFTANVYLVVSPGVKPNPGYGVRIQSMEQYEDSVITKLDLCVFLSLPVSTS
jgi:hypothetical protein